MWWQMIAISVSSAIANDRSESEGYAMKRKKPTHEDVFNKYGEMLRTPGLSERELKERNEEMFKMLVEVGDHTCRIVGDTVVPPGCVADDGPWRTAIDTDIRQLHPDLTQLPPEVATAAAAAGYAAVWAEPVQLGELTAPLALTIWRRRPGNPSPNQLTHIHQGTSIIAAAWSRQPMSS